MSQRQGKAGRKAPLPAQKRSRGLLVSRPWTIASLAVFVLLVTGFLFWGLPLVNALLLGFDMAAIIFLGLSAYAFSKIRPEGMRQRAQATDSGRWLVLLGGVLLAAVVLGALGVELHAAKRGGLLEMGVSVLSVVLSWLFLNVMFAIHYAHGYYGDLGKKHTGLDFPETPEPDYWDFAYFSIVIGMTFQVSDVQITSNYLRRVVLLHSVIAFFFNVFIIAVTVNIVAG